MDSEDIQRVQEAMPDLGVVRRFGVVEEETASPPETTVFIDGDNGGVRFNIDAVRAEDLAEWFDQIAEKTSENS